MQVIPTLLNQTIDEFTLQLTTLSPYFNCFQIDIADGEFVPNRTIQLIELISYFSSHQPQTTNLQFDFHLMVKDYHREIQLIEEVKKHILIKNIFIHFSAINEGPTTNLGIVLNPQDLVTDFVEKIDITQIPAIQIMTVAPGYQGSPFIPNLLKKIEQLRQIGYRNTILIDGGVSEESLPLILAEEYKPDILCVGSYLTKLEKLEDKVGYLRKITATNS